MQLEAEGHGCGLLLYEKDMDMDENEKDTRPDPGQLSARERFYENFRKVPVKYLDIFIGVCVAAFVIVVAVGILKGHGIL